MIPPETVDALIFDLGGVVIEIDFDRALDRWAHAANANLDDLKSRFVFDHAYESFERDEIDAKYKETLARLVDVEQKLSESIIEQQNCKLEMELMRKQLQEMTQAIMHQCPHGNDDCYLKSIIK